MKFITVLGNVAVIASVTLFAAGLAHARAPVTAAEKADHDKQHMAVVAQGDAMWHGGAPKTNGLACGNCHPDGMAIGPQTWPKYSLDLGKVANLREMINWCVMVVQGGASMDLNGPDMLALETYAYYMSRGMALNPGDNSKQMASVKIKGGAGYPTLENTTEFNGGKNPMVTGDKIDSKLKIRTEVTK